MLLRYVLPVALLLAAFAAAPAIAQSPPQPAPGNWDQLGAAQRELLTQPLRDRWDHADAAQRQRMLAHAQRWRDMPAEERMRARRGYDRYDRLHPAQREQMRVLFERTRDMDRETRRHTLVLFHAMRGMDADQRKALVDRWAAMTPQQRQDWVREHAPPRRHGAGPH